jgi:hypothetical protein
MNPNPGYAREARCYGAVARATEIDTLFTAVMRAVARAPDAAMSDELRQKCIEEEVKPYNTTAWRRWLDETRNGKAAPMPPLNWD